MLLSDEELARLQSVAPFLQSEARAALEAEAEYEVTMELEAHLQPGLRIRAPVSADADVPPYPLDLFVGLPLKELRALAHENDAEREAEVARFGARFSPRLLKAIEKMTPHEIDLDAGVQSEAGTLAVMLDES